jgi:hypothetical protein
MVFSLMEKNEKEPVSREQKLLLRAQRLSNIKIVDSDPDYTHILSLAKTTYSDSEATTYQYYDWQFSKNPSGPPIQCIGLTGEIVSGIYMVLPMRYKLGNEEVAGSLSANTMTHPSARGKGVFMVLANQVFDACKKDQKQLTLGFPNTNSYKGFIKHLDFNVIGELPLWLFPGRPHRIFTTKKLIFDPLLTLIWNTLAFLWRFLWRFIGQKSIYKIQEVTDFDSTFERFWNNVSSGYQNILVRNKRYLDWRFKHPTRKYRIFVAKSEHEILGYIITTTKNINGVNYGLLVDILVPNSETGQSIAHSLIDFATRGFLRENVTVIGCLSGVHTHVAKALRKIGYLKCPKILLPQPFPVILRWNLETPSPPNFYDFTNWYLTMGDYDVA